MEKINLLVGAAAFLGATLVVAYIAIVRVGDAATTALGALIALVSAGAGYFLRGRVQAPSTDTETLPLAPVVAVQNADAVNAQSPPPDATRTTTTGGGGILRPPEPKP